MSSRQNDDKRRRSRWRKRNTMAQKWKTIYLAFVQSHLFSIASRGCVSLFFYDSFGCIVDGTLTRSIFLFSCHLFEEIRMPKIWSFVQQLSTLWTYPYLNFRSFRCCGIVWERPTEPSFRRPINVRQGLDEKECSVDLTTRLCPKD